MDSGTRQISTGLTPYSYMPSGDDLSAAEVPLLAHHRQRLNGRRSRSSVQSAPPSLQPEGESPKSISLESPGLLRPVMKDEQAQSGADEHLFGRNSSNSDAPANRSPPSLSSKKSITNEVDYEDHESSNDIPEIQGEDGLIEQVKAAVPGDDPLLTIDTPRMWTMALTSAIVGSSMNLLYSLRYPSVTLTPIVALLVVYPLGLLWDRVFKREGDHFLHDHDAGSSDVSPSSSGALQVLALRTTRTRLRLWLARGRWNRKEHACVFVSSNVSFAFAFATDIITEQVKFYKQDVSMIYQILLILSSQLLGYSLAGMFSEFLVKPDEMIWPSNLIATSMFSTLHEGDGKVDERWQMSRWRFFVIVFGASFAWYFLPGLLIPAFSYFNVLTWIAPDSVIMASLFGVSTGLGMLPLTFDWSQIAYTGSPLIVPFWAAMNVLGGLVVVIWIIAPLLYYSNTFFSSYLPILNASVYDNEGRTYDISKILTPTYYFDEAAYHKYSNVYLPITYALMYAVQFASMTALITHTLCHHGSAISAQMRASLSHGRSSWRYSKLKTSRNEDDGQIESMAEEHVSVSTNRLFAADLARTSSTPPVHRAVPFLWYLATGIITSFTAMFVVEYYHIHLPWWSIFIALAICIVLIVPIGIVMAMTNLQISIYLVSQIAAGLIFPGRGVANMIFVTYTYITSTQALKFSSDLKLGLYMSIPPRVLFKVQLLATIVASLSQIIVLNWAFHNIEGICTPEAVNGFTCPIARVHFNGSVLWGVIGPQRFFGPDALYQPLIWAFPIGAVMPVIVWLISRRPGAADFWRKINFPVIFGSLSWIPPATGLNFSVWALVCFIFNYVIRKRHDEWWKKYNMILSAGLDAGTAVSVLLIFFGIVYWGFADGFSWWGTEVYKQGCDWKGCAWKTLAPGEKFGPDTWK